MQTRASLEASTRPHRLPGWDALRGLAATAVLVLHTAVSRLTDTPVLQDLVAQFQSGVEVFFVVSGFVVARPFIRAVLDRRPLPGIRRYAWRRLLRIFPAYWLALGASAWIFDTTHFRGAGDWVVHALLLQVYWDDQVTRGVGIAWTLSAEVAFYALLPIVFLATQRLASRLSPWTAVTGLGVVLVLVGWVWTGWVMAGDHFLKGFWLPSFLPVFGAGMLLCVAAEYVDRHPRAQPLAARIGDHAGLWWAGAAGLLVVGALTFEAVSFPLYRLTYTGIATLLVVPVAIGFRADRSVGRLLELRPVVYLGTVSYGLYLWHTQLAHFVAADIFGWTSEAGSALIVTIVTFVLAVAVASLSWFIVERPLQRWARRLMS